MFINLFLYKNQWALFDKLASIDRDLRRYFGIYFPYAVLTRYTINHIFIMNLTKLFSYEIVHLIATTCCRILTILVVLMLLQTVIITVIVYFCFKEFMSPPSHAINSCAALLLSTGSIFATVTLFNVHCMFLIQRIQCINLILNQLLINEPISDTFLFFDQMHFPHEFVNRKTNFGHANCETSTNWISSTSTNFHWKWQLGAKKTGQFTKSRMMRSHANDTMKNVAAGKISSVKSKIKTKRRMEIDSKMHHMDYLMNTFTLADIKLIATRM